MSLRGQLQPIIITGSGALVCGYHRLEAARLLDWTEIEVRVLDLSPVEAELAELEENLVRSELTVLERGEHYCRRKSLHEKLYPETRQGGAPGLPGGGKAKTTGRIGFVRDTAVRLGRAESVVREELRIGALPAPVKQELVGTPGANDKGRLLSLTRLSGEAQLAAARRLAQGLPVEERPAEGAEPSSHPPGSATRRPTPAENGSSLSNGQVPSRSLRFAGGCRSRGAAGESTLAHLGQANHGVVRQPDRGQSHRPRALRL